MTESILIDKKRVGPDAPTFLIAEIGQAHDGSLGMAHAYIDAVADAGADAIKFQTHIASAESTLDEPFRVRFSMQDETRYSYWERMEFSADRWAGLADHAREKGLVFLSSAFSIEAVEMLRKVGMPAWKIGSGEVANKQLLEAMAVDEVPILLSTGMSTYDEIHGSYHLLQDRRLPVAILQCTSRYPTPLEEVGLNVLAEFQKRFDCPVGLSDHSGTIYPSVAAMAQGVDLVEIHVTFDRRMFGPDTIASVTIEELTGIVEAKRAFDRMKSHPVDKDKMAGELARTRELFTKSIALKRELEKGTALTEDVLTLKKPGTGIPASELDNVIGRRLARRVVPNRLLSYEDLDE